MRCVMKRRISTGLVQGVTCTVSDWSPGRRFAVAKAETGKSFSVPETIADPDRLSIRNILYLISGRRLLACCG